MDELNRLRVTIQVLTILKEGKQHAKEKSWLTANEVEIALSRLIYAPKVLDDLQEVKVYIAKQFGGDKVKVCLEENISTVRQLEVFPKEGPCLADLIEYPTDYHYLIVRPIYIFIELGVIW